MITFIADGAQLDSPEPTSPKTEEVTGTIFKNERITAAMHFQDVRHIEIDADVKYNGPDVDMRPATFS